MRDKLWLHDKDNTATSLHSGPFLPCRHKGPVCDINGLKCAACLCAKAQRQSTSAPAPRDPDDLTRFRLQLNGDTQACLKQNHVSPGDCISADHYISTINGRLYSSFGR